MAYEGVGSSSYSGGGTTSYGMDGSYSGWGDAPSSSSSSYSTNKGPEFDFSGGQAYTPGFLDSVKSFFGDNAGTMLKAGGALLGGPMVGTLAGLAGDAWSKYSTGDQANQITNYNADGTVTGWRPTGGAALAGGSATGGLAGGSYDSSLNHPATSDGGGAPGGAYNLQTAFQDYLKSTQAPASPTAGMSTADAQAYYASQAALQNTALNRPDQNTPYGSQNWTVDPNDPNKWTSDITLDPTQQKLLDAQNQGALGKSDLANKLIEKLQTEGAPGWQGSVNLQKDAKIQNIVPTAATAGGASAAQGSIDLSGLSAIPEVSDEVRQRVEQALYDRSTSRLDPMWQQRQDELNTQLANQGITLGSGAFDTSVGQFGRDRNDAYQTALNESIIGGGTEQSRLFDLAMKPREQQFAEQSKVADVSLANAGLTTNASIANANNATQVANANAARELEAAKANAQFQLDSMLAGNSAQLGEMNANNGAINQILNSITSLQQGTGPTIPTFASGQSGTSVNPVDYAGIKQTDYLNSTAKKNAETQADNANMAAWGGLASSLIGSFF